MFWKLFFYREFGIYFVRHALEFIFLERIWHLYSRQNLAFILLDTPWNLFS